MQWRELIQSHGLVVSEPAAEAELPAAADALGAELPGELAELLMATDGVRGAYDVELVWPLRRPSPAETSPGGK